MTITKSLTLAALATLSLGLGTAIAQDRVPGAKPEFRHRGVPAVSHPVTQIPHHDMHTAPSGLAAPDFVDGTPIGAEG